MKIKTTVDVNCPIQGKVVGYTGKLIGKLTGVMMYPNPVVMWHYEQEDGKIILKGEPYRLTFEQVDNILSVSPINSMSVAEQVFYVAMKVEMASTFGISVNQFETVN